VGNPLDKSTPTRSALSGGITEMMTCPGAGPADGLGDFTAPSSLPENESTCQELQEVQMAPPVVVLHVGAGEEAAVKVQVVGDHQPLVLVTSFPLPARVFLAPLVCAPFGTGGSSNPSVSTGILSAFSDLGPGLWHMPLLLLWPLTPLGQLITCGTHGTLAV
jgi:hypothetical protein